jgi:choline dehydrogenase
MSLNELLRINSSDSSSLNLTSESCRFDEATGFPFYWDKDCKDGMLGCSADNKSLSCRFCGEPPYESIKCPEQLLQYMASSRKVPEQAAWIIIGGGAAGCAAAAALADAGEDVLVLERGLSDREIPSTQQAGTWPFVINTEATEHIRWLDGVWGTVAKVLGGGTSINGGYSFEESPEWIQEHFGPEINLDVLYNSSAFLGKDLASPVQPNAFAHSWKTALCSGGYGCADEEESSLRWKDGAWIAMDTMNTSKPDIPRRSAAVLLHERAHLTNLRVMTQAQVHRILFNESRATGVRVSLEPAMPWFPRSPVTITATKGVILSAGAIYSPQLLQLSGIGRKGCLDRIGVKPVVPELPDVGANFVDRLVMNLDFRAKKHTGLSIGWVVAMNRTLNMTFEVEAGGHINSEFAIASLALDEPMKRDASLRGFMKTVMRNPNDQPSLIADNINKGMDILALQHEVYSRGWIEAESLDATRPPLVKANYFEDKRDYLNQQRAIQELLNIAGQPSMDEWIQRKIESSIPDSVLTKELKCALLGGGYRGVGSQDPPFEVIPCLPSQPASQEDWAKWLHEHHVSSYHYFGTVAYGAVLEGPELRVKGTEGLHVVDASIFPKPTRVNPQHMIMTMGHYLGSMLARREANVLTQQTSITTRRRRRVKSGASALIIDGLDY